MAGHVVVTTCFAVCARVPMMFLSCANSIVGTGSDVGCAGLDVSEPLRRVAQELVRVYSGDVISS